MNNTNKEDRIKFLGTSGARFVMAKQLRSSSGTWCSFQGTNIMIDPGPGTLVKCFAESPPLDPANLDTIILTHRHLDHSGDINALAEAMTNGTYNRRGSIYLPSDALYPEPVLFSYIRKAVEEVIILKEGGNYRLNNSFSLETPVRHDHSVETYGLFFNLPYGKIAFIADTKPFKDLTEHYKADILIINVVMYKKIEKKEIKHMDIDGVRDIINKIRPEAVILTHFGLTMLNQDPEKLALDLSSQTGVKVIAASDGMTIYPQRLLIKTEEEIFNGI